MNLFETGVRPVIDEYLIKKAQEKRDYGDYWSASSAGYCMRKNIFDRLGCPPVTEDARKYRVFESGHIFHQWIQGLTKESGLSIAQELELQDEDLMIRGHIDDLVLVRGVGIETHPDTSSNVIRNVPDHLILYDYKTVNSQSFKYKKDKMSYFHRMQLGTYMYMLRNKKDGLNWDDPIGGKKIVWGLTKDLTEARICYISKDDLRMAEKQLLWSDELEKDVLTYWKTLNKYWAERKLPPCTCADREGGFMSKEKWNPYFYEDEPCSAKWLTKCREEGLLKNAPVQA